MSRVAGPRAPVTLAIVLALGAGVGGCFDNVTTPLDDAGFVGDAGPFRPGLEPWDAVNVATRPAATASDPCPEEISFTEVEDYRRADAMHARACIHAPMADVWRALQNPQAAASPDDVEGWNVVEPSEHCTADASYETHLFVEDIVDVDFFICWRHQVIEGTEAAPLFGAMRWEKIFGTSAISRLEGSILAHPLEADESITELELQYHLSAASADHNTIRSYLTIIYDRIRDDAHGVAIPPAP